MRDIEVQQRHSRALWEGQNRNQTTSRSLQGHLKVELDKFDIHLNVLIFVPFALLERDTRYFKGMKCSQ